MAVSKRERTLGLAAAVVIGLLAVDQYLLTPIFNDEDQLQLQRQDLLTELEHSRKVLNERKALMPKWKTMLETGLKTDTSEAEGQLLHALRDWARETKLTLSSQKPDRPESKSTLREIIVEANAVGSMEAIAKFMFKMKSAAFPLKLTEFQVAAQNESSNSLTLQIKVSTLYKESEQRSGKGDKGDKGKGNKGDKTEKPDSAEPPSGGVQ
jgi:Tfp pilus assembly protein PilO